MTGSTQPDRILIAIKPPDLISNKVKELRAIINEITGENIYGNHDPHITLFLNSFERYSDAEFVVKKVASGYKPFEVVAESLYDFPSDPVNKSHTVVYKIVPSQELRILQQLLTADLNVVRTKDQEQSLLEKKAYNNEKEKQSIFEYGWPYSPESWVFHLSIGSVRDQEFEQIWDVIKSNPVDMVWTVDSLATYTKYGNGPFELFHEYPFGGH